MKEFIVYFNYAMIGIYKCKSSAVRKARALNEKHKGECLKAVVYSREWRDSSTDKREWAEKQSDFKPYF